jgi:hypothetical protein
MNFEIGRFVILPSILEGLYPRRFAEMKPFWWYE